MNIGCHLSVANGLESIGKSAIDIGANTFQFFLRNPRGGKASFSHSLDVSKLGKFLKDNNFAKVLVHAPYTMNLCSDDEHKRNFAKEMLKEDLLLMENMPGNYYNIHPGFHVGAGVYAGIAHIIDSLNDIIFQDQKTVILLETMSGKGSEIGSTFEEISEIIGGVEYSDKLGVCLDTCHVYSAGYDIANHLDDVLTEFDRQIGLSRLCAIHLNDSMHPLNAHKDRHAKMEEGTIGLDAIVNIINHEKLRDLPFILETPNDINGFKKEISLLKPLCEH